MYVTTERRGEERRGGWREKGQCGFSAYSS
jgi:hypothetical protein